MKLRYKRPDGDKSTLLELPLKKSSLDGSTASRDFRFASSVALFGMILRQSSHVGQGNLNTVLSLAKEGLGEDKHGYRQEFVELVTKARQLYGVTPEYRYSQRGQ